jgi:hypothetical protein
MRKVDKRHTGLRQEITRRADMFKNLVSSLEDAFLGGRTGLPFLG